jgi:hypothetical protein
MAKVTKVDQENGGEFPEDVRRQKRFTPYVITIIIINIVIIIIIIITTGVRK